MMTNLFSTFDPSTSNMMNLNWLSSLIPFIFMTMVYWNTPSRINSLTKMMFNYINSEMKNNMSNHNQKTFIILFSIFWFIFMNNLMGLYPYIFTSTSHLTLTLTLTLPIWLTFMIFGWLTKSTYMFSHLVPTGTPILLSSFMVLIETISNIIRPITLSVRLTANMIAGHLLLTLLSNISENLPQLYLLTFFLVFTLLILEYAVAIIQSYVFITLISLYLTEIN